MTSRYIHTGPTTTQSEQVAVSTKPQPASVVVPSPFSDANGVGGAGGSDPDQHVAERLVFSVDDAAHLLDISRAFAYELVARGEIPAIRLGRRIVIPRVALERLLGTAEGTP
jgi:excisionase family DNA binding protein